VHLVRYADDFVVLSKTKEALEETIVPAIQSFLEERGLRLHPIKTVITHLDQGFDFLGFNFKLRPSTKNVTGKGLWVTPTKKGKQRLKDKVKAICKLGRHWTSYRLIQKLSPIIRGWRNYYKHVNSKRIFTKIDWFIWHRLFKWASVKHKNLGARKVYELYYHRSKTRKRVFFGTQNGKVLELPSMRSN
jgi:RNA-directed DNA polymerase